MKLELTFGNFARSTVLGKQLIESYVRIKNVYDYLCAHKDEKFSPTAIAESLRNTAPRSYLYNKNGVSKALHVLEEMGLVDKISYQKVIEIESHTGYRRDYKIIDGLRYVAYIPTDTFEKEVTLYKWFAL